MRPTIFWILLFVVLTSLSFWHDEVEFRGLESQQSASDRTTVELQIAIRREIARISRDNAGPTATRPQRQKQEQAIVPARLAAPPSVMHRLRNSPELQRLWLASRRAELASKYRAFFRSASVPDDVAQAVLDAVTDHEEKDLDLMAIRDDDRSQLQALAKLRQMNNAELESRERAVLGDDKYRQLVDFEQSVPARNIAGALAAAASLQGQALSSAQAEQLARTISAAAVDANGKRVSTLNIDWNKVDREAETFLTVQQIAILKNSATGSVSNSVGRHSAAFIAVVKKAAESESRGQTAP